ncbi:unnamed protein product [Notodromas monacha]|uniref:Cytosolic Fe-S cluster assembly factor NUBP1 homolog n=1 Tax=Notodromas monacha TaxID=399045 RepID=A0A7R9BNA1_9CRUS|nr:unnamed protein product [Notodromas monacha]CAG0917814.1 unnamed protein product [Notodromas monacha]
MDVPQDAPAACPGTGSGVAGKVSACQGCPNQSVCASGEQMNPDSDIAAIKEKLLPIANKIMVMSGKGGVGKTSVTAMLARGLAKRYPTSHIAVLDVDVCGPSMPRVMGVEGESVHVSGMGWSPVAVDDNISVMSIGFLLENLSDAVVWRGPKKNGLIKQFLRDVDWGPADYLLIDTPPGTSDEHLSVVQFLLPANPKGAVIVTTPQEVSLLDVRKEINFCKKVKLPILGVVENMKRFVCPSCNHESDIFPAMLSGGTREMCDEMGVAFLGSLPLDPSVGRLCDLGEDPMSLNDDGQRSRTVTPAAIAHLVEAVDEAIKA